MSIIYFNSSYWAKRSSPNFDFWRRKNYETSIKANQNRKWERKIDKNVVN